MIDQGFFTSWARGYMYQYFW